MRRPDSAFRLHKRGDMKRSLTYGGLLTGMCIVFAALSLVLSGCSAVKQVLNIENPRYSIRNIRPRVDIALPLSASSIDFDFTVGVDNPNAVAIKLDRLDFNLFVNDNRILESTSDQRINIPANNYGEMHLQTRVGYQNIRSLFTEVADVIRGNRARYELRGNAYYDTPLGRMKFPVTVYSTGGDSRR